MAKVKVNKHQILVDEKFTGEEPRWNAEHAAKLTDLEFNNLLRKSLNYYNYHYTPRDLKKKMTEWMRTQPQFTKEKIKGFDRVSDRIVSPTLCGLVMAIKSGMPAKKRHMQYIVDTVDLLIDTKAIPAEDETEIDTKPAKQGPTIQDRLSEKTNELMGEIEGKLDEIVQGKAPAFKCREFLSEHNVPVNQLNKYEKVFSSVKREFEKAREGRDEQLAEGYKFMGKSDFKRVIGFLDDVLESVQQYKTIKNATKKVRAKKPVNKIKLASRLKYCKEFKDLKLVSINPVDIIGAQELWTYNTKTRKLGNFVADAYQTLGIKGTTITGYSESGSICKTLRKPEEKLKEFSKAGKVQLRKFLGSIRGIEVRLRGRINSDTILLKVL